MAADGAALDDAALDGAASDGAVLDGAALDGAASDGAALDGAALDGAALDGAVPDGRGSDDAASDGAAPVSTASDGVAPAGDALDRTARDDAALGSAATDGPKPVRASVPTAATAPARPTPARRESAVEGGPDLADYTEPAASEPEPIVARSAAAATSAADSGATERGAVKPAAQSGDVTSAAADSGVTKSGVTKSGGAEPEADATDPVVLQSGAFAQKSLAETSEAKRGRFKFGAARSVVSKLKAPKAAAPDPVAIEAVAAKSASLEAPHSDAPVAAISDSDARAAAVPDSDARAAAVPDSDARAAAVPDSDASDVAGPASDSAGPGVADPDPDADPDSADPDSADPDAASPEDAPSTQEAAEGEQAPGASGTPGSGDPTAAGEQAAPGSAGTTGNGTPKKPKKPGKTKLPGKDPLWAKASVTFGIVLVLLAGTVLGGMRYLANRYNHSVTQQTLLAPQARVNQPAQEAHNALTGPLNFLLLGSDLRANNPEDGQRSDTIIIVHIPATLDRAYMISIPRDLRVEIPPFAATGFGGAHEKINGAFEYGGAGAGGVQLLSQTLTNLTGVQFDGAAVINFDGFEQAVELLGGIDLCVDVATESHFIGYDKDGNFLAPYYGPDLAYRNHDSTPLVYEPGCRHFPAYQALDYVRQRKSLPNGDYDRQRHQQQFVKAIFDEAQAQNLTSNPLKLDKFIRAVGSSLTVDTNGVSIDDLLFGLRGVRPAGMRGIQVPSAPEMIGGISYVIQDPAADGLYKALKNDTLEDWASHNPTWLNQL